MIHLVSRMVCKVTPKAVNVASAQQSVLASLFSLDQEGLFQCGMKFQYLSNGSLILTGMPD